MAIKPYYYWQVGWSHGDMWEVTGYGDTLELAKLDLEMSIIKNCPTCYKLDEYRESLKTQYRWNQTQNSHYICSECEATPDHNSCTDDQCREHECYGFAYDDWKLIRKEYLKLRNYYRNYRLKSGDFEQILTQVTNKSDLLKMYFHKTKMKGKNYGKSAKSKVKERV